MHETLVTLTGNLVNDVTLRTTSRGEAVATFRLASTATRYDRESGRWVDGDTCYFNVTAWRRAAENARDSLAKGHPVVVHGRLRQRVVDRQVAGASGVAMPVTYTEVEATSFGLDLSRCRARYQRAPLGPQTSGPDPAPWAAGVPTGQGSGEPAPSSASGPVTQGPAGQGEGVSLPSRAA